MTPLVPAPVQELLTLFSAPGDTSKLERLRQAPTPAVKYMIAMTPRSGSSYLCDVLGQTQRLGAPGEFLASSVVASNRSRAVATDSPDEYVELMLRRGRTANGVSGFKTSWFQFKSFTTVMRSPQVFSAYKVIYLTRRHLAAQAVSLYRMTSTRVSHTNIEHSSTQLEALEALPYDYDKIKSWHKHLLAQEQGWQDYFAQHSIHPLCITYEDIDADVGAVCRRIAAYLGRPKAAASIPTTSVFRKLAGRPSVEWAAQFELDWDAEQRTSPTPAPTA